MRETIKQFARNCLELNADAGLISSVKMGAEMNEVQLSMDEIEELAFELVQEQDQNPEL